MNQQKSFTCSCAIPDLAQELTIAWTVNDVLRCCPSSIVVLSDFGIDTCCGGDATLEDAAKNAGIIPEQLLAALMSAAIDFNQPSCGHHSITSTP